MVFAHELDTSITTNVAGCKSAWFHLIGVDEQDLALLAGESNF